MSENLNKPILKTVEGDNIIEYKDGRVTLNIDNINIRYGKYIYSLYIDGDTDELKINKRENKNA